MPKSGVRRDLRDSLSSLSVSEFLWAVGFLSLAFETFLRDYFNIFNYLDEGIALLLFASAILRIIGRKNTEHLNNHERIACAALFVFLLIGLAGNVFGGVQVAVLGILIDLFACSKFFLALISGFIVFSLNADRIVSVILSFAKPLIIFMLVCSILNIFIDIGMSNGSVRGGLRAFSFIFYHPTVVNVVCVGFAALFATDVSKNKRYILACLVVMILTLRTKGIAFSVVAFSLLLLINNGKRISLHTVIIAIVAALFVGYDQFSTYYIDSDEARLRLTEASIQIANDHMPIGTGFATFGSNVTASASFYSPLYFEYGLSTVWGLTPDNPSFVSDTFFPIIIGQFGWTGLAVFTFFIVHVFLSVYRRAKASSGADILSVLLVFTYLLISSTAESAFFSNAATYFAICLALSCQMKRGTISVNESAECRRTDSRIASDSTVLPSR